MEPGPPRRRLRPDRPRPEKDGKGAAGLGEGPRDRPEVPIADTTDHDRLFNPQSRKAKTSISEDHHRPDPKRILAVLPTFSDFGGVQATAALAWEALGEAPGVEPFLFQYGDRAYSSPQANAFASSRPGALLAAAATKGRWDVALYWHLSLAKLSPAFRPKPRRQVLFLHGIECWHPLSWMERRLLDRIDLVLTNSDYTWQRFLATNPWAAGKEHRTVHLGIGEPLLGVPPEPEGPVGIIIGRLESTEDYKGHRELIATWPEVRSRVQGAEFWIVGDGSLRPELEARSGGEGKGIRFLGAISHERKQELLKRASCLLMPSRNEGFGLVYLEAMRLGRPCLVSDRDAGREVVDPPTAGLAVDPGDQGALAAAVKTLLEGGSPPAGNRDACRDRYAAQFTAASFRSRLRAAIGELN